MLGRLISRCVRRPARPPVLGVAICWFVVFGCEANETANEHGATSTEQTSTTRNECDDIQILCGSDSTESEAGETGTTHVIDARLLFRLAPPTPLAAALGEKVLIVGDMNGDGRAEIAMDDARDGEPGCVYVVFGKPDMSDVVLEEIAAGRGGFVINGETGTMRLPWSMDDAGDINGDSIPDLVLGNINVWIDGDRVGAAYVVFGKGDGARIDLDSVVAGVGGFVVRGALANDDVGEKVAGGSDINGDGLSDVVIGAPGAHVDGESVGRAYVVFGKADGDVVELAEIAGSGAGFSLTGRGGNAGVAVDMPGDLNGDAWPDLVVGAPAESATSPKSGRAYAVFGGPDIGTLDLVDVVGGGAAGFVIESTGSFESAGGQAIGLGDVNGDGLADLYVTSGPRGHVVFGKAGTDPVYLGDLGSDGFEVVPDVYLDGGGLATAMGDVDGDGLADFVLGGFGSPMMLGLGKTDTEPFHASRIRDGLVGGAIIEANGDAFGWGFSGGGDVNGDGIPDLAVGRPVWFEEPSMGFVYGF